MKKRAVILGGGMMGLTTAYYLSKRGWKTTVLEKNEKLGGIISSTRVNGAWIEDCYHNMFKSYSHLLPLLEELGVRKKIVWKPAPTAFYAAGKLFAVNAPWHILRFPALSFWEKVKLAKLLVQIQYFTKNPLEYDDETARDFVTRKCGCRVYEKFMRPLINGKFEGSADRVSASWLTARLQLRNERGLKGEIMGYITGSGFKNIVDALSARIRKNGGSIKTKANVRSVIVKQGKAVGVQLAGGKTLKADVVVSTVPPSVFVKLCKFPKAFVEKVNLPTQGAVSVLLGLNKKITNEHYWTNVMDDCAFRAVVEQTNWAPASQYNGMHFVYLASYPSPASRVWRMSDKQIINLYFKDLQKLYPNVTRKSLKYAHVYANPTTTVKMLTGVGLKMTSAGNETPVKHLYSCNAVNCFPETLLDRCTAAVQKCVAVIEKKER